MKQFDWSDLYYFNAVAQQGSLSKAAQMLGVTHSTVFRRISSLEEALSIKLFDRLPEGYRLTQLGEELARYSESVSSTIDDMQRMLSNRNEDLEGTINLTAPHNFAYRFLPPIIDEFKVAYPDIVISLMASNEDFNLSRREADLAIRATAAPPEHLIGQRLFTLRWGAYASQRYLERHSEDGTIESFSGQQVILANRSLSNLAVFKWAAGELAESQVAARCNDLVSMSALAVAGCGIALLPDDQAKPELVRLFALDPQFTSCIWTLMHPDLRGCTRLLVFKDFVRERLRQEPVFQQYGLPDPQDV